MPKIRGDNIADHKKRTMAALHRAGTDLFVEFGFATVTLGAIADRAGIGRTTIYEYFDSKESLLTDVVHHRVPHVLQRLVAQLEHRHPADRLEELFRACVEQATSDADAAHLLFRVTRELSDEGRPPVWRAFDPVVEEIERVVTAGVRSGHFADRNPQILQRIVKDHLVSAIDSVMEFGPRDKRRRELVEERVKFLRSGLAA